MAILCEYPSGIMITASVYVIYNAEESALHLVLLVFKAKQLEVTLFRRAIFSNCSKV
jgi:hypothetical protein